VVTGSQAADVRNTMVTSRIERPEGGPVTVVWQVRDSDGGYLAIDSIVEGVSLVRALREEFTSVVRNNGGDVGTLITMMRDVLDETG
jgi:phospholipid transport system substrate-binding protein